MSIQQSQLYARGAVTVGRFVWTSFAPGQRRASRIGSTHLLVIPRHPVRITQHGAGEPFVADPACAVFYNAQTPYEAEQLVDEGEESVFFELDDAAVRDVAAEYGVAGRAGLTAHHNV